MTALAPLAQDVVITGHDHNEIGALVFLAEAARRRPQAGVAAEAQRALRALKADGGSSQVPMRMLLLSDAPSLAAGEITDKGYINRRLTLQRRAADVAALYATPRDPRVISA